MNDKQSILYKIVEICVDCCSHDINGKPTITIEDVLGKCRKENVVLTRIIATHIIISFGYTRTTVAELFGVSTKAVAQMLDKGHYYIQTSWAFKCADAQATLRCNDLKSELT